MLNPGGVAIVGECLRHGAWLPREQPLQLPNATIKNFSTKLEIVGADGVQKYVGDMLSVCHPRRQTWLAQSEWRSMGPHCTDIVEDAFTGHFGGVFDDPARPVAMHFIGDSLSRQQANSIAVAQAINPRLATLNYTKMLHFSLIPSTRRGCESLLAELMQKVSSQTRSTRHLIMISTGAWYNLAQKCNQKCTKVSACHGCSPGLDPWLLSSPLPTHDTVPLVL